jgi:hypothetical protein
MVMADQGKKKSSKADRNRKWCVAYRNRNQREINKATRLLKHFARYGLTDHTAVHCYNNLPLRVKSRDKSTLVPQPTKRKHLAVRSTSHLPLDGTSQRAS